jgi:hypothetical protein
LVNNSIDSNSSLTKLTVADDQFALAATDRHHASIALIPVCSGWLTDWRVITPEQFFQLDKKPRKRSGLCRHRLAERVNNAANQSFANRHFKNTAGRSHFGAFANLFIIS